MEPITREERLMASAAGGEASGIKPVTREEMFLAYAAGESDTKPTPITRREMFLDKIEGGGGSTPTQEKSITITENGTVEVTPDEGFAISKVTANAQVYDAVDDRFAKWIEEGPPATLSDANATSVALNLYKGNTKLESVDLPNVVTVGESAFNDCSSLSSINLPKVETIGSNSFLNCSAFGGDLYFPNLKGMSDKSFSNTSIKSFSAPNYESHAGRSYTFQNCTELEWVSFPKAESFGSTGSPFYGCTSLRRVSFPSGYATSYWSTFKTCTSLKFVDLLRIGSTTSNTTNKLPTATESTSIRVIVMRSPSRIPLYSVPTDGVFAEDGVGGYIIVPTSVIPDYISYTNWSALVELGTVTFLPLEEYTVDGTVDGELDWDKVEALIPNDESGGTEE